MAKIKIKGFIVASQTSYEKEPSYYFFSFKPNGEHHVQYVTIQEHTIEVDIPDNFDMTPGKIANLQELRRIENAKFAARVKAINEEISKLQCLEHSPSAGAAE